MPVYNAERTLDRAIISVLNQSETKWELIAVDDGSADASSLILDRFAEQDCRIRVIHQQNSGVASARSKGISLAKGEYCIHVDADDWVEPDFLENLISKATETNADLVWCDAYKSKINSLGVEENEVWQHACEEDPSLMVGHILRQEFWGCLWNKLIRTSICQREDVVMPVPCQIWEDVSFVCQVLIHCKTISHISKPLYHYNIGNLDSLLHQQSSQTGKFSGDLQNSINCIERSFHNAGIHHFDYEITWQKLCSIRDYIDDKRYRDYDRFMNTYPEVIAKIKDYPKYPQRLFWVALALKYKLGILVPVIMKIDAVCRRLS